MHRGGASILGGIAVAACLLLAAPASAATLVGDYQLQGTRASSGAGPSLTDINGPNSFQTDTVMGQPRQVLTFPQGSGLQMSTTGLIPDDEAWSVVLTFRFDAISGFRRIVDNRDGMSEEGLYDHDSRLDIFELSSPFDNESSDGVLTAGTYATVGLVTLTNGTPSIKGYVNGVPVAQVNSNPADRAILNNTLRFFKDDGSEESAGAVSCIRAYDGSLSDADVAAIGPSPSCGGPPPASPASPVVTHRKKCKKHKKKHKRSAESAKKKKCKKRKKR